MQEIGFKLAATPLPAWFMLVSCLAYSSALIDMFPGNVG
jgi:hypothetical protein